MFGPVMSSVRRASFSVVSLGVKLPSCVPRRMSAFYDTDLRVVTELRGAESMSWRVLQSSEHVQFGDGGGDIL